MNSDTSAPPSSASMSRRFVRTIFRRRVFAVLLGLITLFALFHAVENFRGKRAWDRYAKAAVERGVDFDFAACIPPPVPDEQNAANNWVVASWFPKPRPEDPNWPPLLSKAEQRVRSRHNSPDKRTTERFVDLVALKEALAKEQSGETNGADRLTEQERTPTEQAAAAPAVLEALRIYQPALNEFRAAAKRPHIRYPVDYKLNDPFSILLPHLAKVKSIVQELRVEASAKLVLGQSDDALQDVMFMLWLTDSIHEEPFLINQVVRIACLQITIQPIWEGLATHRWSDEHLRKLQERLSKYDFVADLEKPIAAERAASVGVIHRLRRDTHSRPGLGELFDVGTQPPVKRKAMSYISSLVPQGWFYYEALNYCTLLDTQIKDGVNLSKRTINAQQMDGNEAEMDQALDAAKGFNALLRHQFFARVLLPALKNSTRKFAMAQVAADQAQLACALERYRLAHGKLPNDLDALVPQFISKLPHDVFNGEPLKYKRLNDEFVLSSVGWPLKTGNRPGEWTWHSSP